MRSHHPVFILESSSHHKHYDWNLSFATPSTSQITAHENHRQNYGSCRVRWKYHPHSVCPKSTKALHLPYLGRYAFLRPNTEKSVYERLQTPCLKTSSCIHQSLESWVLSFYRETLGFLLQRRAVVTGVWSSLWVWSLHIDFSPRARMGRFLRPG